MGTIANLTEERPMGTVTEEELQPIEGVDELNKVPPQKKEEKPEETAEEKPVDETEKPVEEKKPVEDKKENHFERRQRRLLQERAEFKAKAELYEKIISGQQQTAAQTGKPERSQFQDDISYMDSLTDWKLEQKLGTVRQELSQQNAQSAVVNEWNQKVTTARALYPDYDDVMADADDVQLTQSVQDSIMDSKYGADIAYYMAQNKDDAQRILSLPPKAADREIGRIESYIEQSLKSKPAVPPVSNAPKPVQPPRATSSGLTRDLEKMSPAEFASYRNEQIRKKKQR